MLVTVFSAELGSTADTCTASVYGACCKLSYFPRGFWEMTSCLSPYSALSLVRQRIHALRQSTELVVSSHIFHVGFWEMTSCWSPYSALSLVRQRTHALRQSTRLLEEFHTLSWFTLGDDFMLVSVFSAELGSTADTCTASVYEA